MKTSATNCMQLYLKDFALVFQLGNYGGVESQEKELACFNL